MAWNINNFWMSNDLHIVCTYIHAEIMLLKYNFQYFYSIRYVNKNWHSWKLKTQNGRRKHPHGFALATKNQFMWNNRIDDFLLMKFTKSIACLLKHLARYALRKTQSSRFYKNFIRPSKFSIIPLPSLSHQQ